MDLSEEEIFDTIDAIKSCPPVLVYEGLCKIAAEHSFSKQNDLDGIYYLSESHSVSLRHKAEQAANALIRKTSFYDPTQNSIPQRQVSEDPFCPKIWKDAVCFNHHYSLTKGQGLLERIKGLPKDWTVVQVTAAYDLQFAVNPESHRYSCPPRLYVSRMECGSEQPLIYSSAVDLMPSALYTSSSFHYQQLRPIVHDGTKSFLEELRDIIEDNKNVNKNPKKFSRARDYWALRAEHNNRMKLLLGSIESHWLRGWKCLFLGKLVNPSERKTVEAMVKSVVTSPGVPPNLPARSVAILSQIIASHPCLSHSDMQFLLKDVLPNPNSKALEVLTKVLQDVCSSSFGNSITPWQWERHPVILVLDKRIENIPWEVLPSLRSHPFSRVPSIHFVHGLSLDKSHLLPGDKEVGHSVKEADVDANQAYYVVNPDGSLPKTEERMVKYLERRPETWNGTRGVEPTAKEFLSVVEANDIVLYCGHGSGRKYLQHSLAYRGSYRVVMLLMGCHSVNTHRLAANLDPWGTVYEYTLARSPCVVGMLWEVTDLECDLVTMKLIDNWLGPLVDGSKARLKKRSSKKELSKDGTHASDASVNLDSKGKLLKAMVDARDAATQFMTSAAMVSYGIPVQATKSSVN